MKLASFLLLFLCGTTAFAQTIINGGDYYNSDYSNHGGASIWVNGKIVCSTSGNWITGGNGYTGWLGNVYVKDCDSTESDLFYGPFITNYLYCNIFIQPGDSVWVIDSAGLLNRIFYAPDTIYETQEQGNGCDFDYTNYFTTIIQYMPDYLEQQYMALLEQAYAAMAKDSLQKIAAAITADSLGAIQDIELGVRNVIYPNPTTGLLNFTNYYTVNESFVVRIFDMQGKEMLSQSYSASPGLQSNTLDMGMLTDGVYLVQYSVNGKSRMEKVVKM